MAKTIIIDDIDLVAATVRPASGPANSYSLHFKYAMKAAGVIQFYKDQVFYNSVSLETPKLPAGMETDTNTFLAALKTRIKTYEGV